MAESLRKKAEGVSYTRPPEVENQIDELSAVTELDHRGRGTEW